MSYLYLILNLGSLSIPLFYSFEKDMRFIKHWKAVVTSLTIVAAVFLIWDAIFTKNGVWGFNPDYHLSFFLLGMPIEEWLFFFCIPYASVFIHYALAYFKPNWLLSKKLTKILTVCIILIALTVGLYNYDKAYTIVNYLFLGLVLILGYFYGVQYLQRFYIAFVIILIPFFIVNGVLTGTGIEEPVVWYNDNENLGIRLLTIPVEDIGYAFSMLFTNVLLIEYFKEKETYF
ncbi:lycopene cyclase domain-containing protein [Tenacibaculum sp. IB213877]|uniref:lycopene cyclase domain-containing protein n=1 Tax=Tenacibaculum sp. IB213877 TaxID=3097351 RepID=UPI002A5A3D0D|nr:lycopene cyclase domain-containing protein [Tenacibaculum sp. IB213877]MDY0779218.1 lycopene cyclase domain-containing protein [Tenacibaculum sp. IB213877]